ncbi:hypothetical protein QQZ08_005763 [Neonectria magnoliae]|uniref:Uncharacterized protein n=1 Tax=Neonectria magnoliae TaxID=2732573 RepID=A0ABR1I3Y5_9HYPO
MMHLATFLLAFLVSAAVADTDTNRAIVQHEPDEIQGEKWLSLRDDSVRHDAVSVLDEGITVDTCTDPEVLVDVGVAGLADLTTVKVTTTMTTIMTLGLVPGTTTVADSKRPVHQATTQDSTTASSVEVGVPTITETEPLHVISSGTLREGPEVSLAWAMMMAILLFW